MLIAKMTQIKPTKRIKIPLMNQYLSKHFATNAERVDYHVYGIYGDIEFEPRAKFIIGLDGMLCEESMVIGQNDLSLIHI